MKRRRRSHTERKERRGPGTNTATPQLLQVGRALRPGGKAQGSEIFHGEKADQSFRLSPADFPLPKRCRPLRNASEERKFFERGTRFQIFHQCRCSFHGPTQHGIDEIRRTVPFAPLHRRHERTHKHCGCKRPKRTEACRSKKKGGSFILSKFRERASG